MIRVSAEEKVLTEQVNAKLQQEVQELKLKGYQASLTLHPIVSAEVLAEFEELSQSEPIKVQTLDELVEYIREF